MSPKTIYNHDIMHCTHSAVTGNYLYASRVLGLTNPDDIVQLCPEVKSDWNAITAHYDRIGLNYSQNIIWDVNLRRLVEHPDYQTSVFIFGDTVHPGSTDEAYFRQIDPDWLDIVNFINNKNNFIQVANELGVKTPETWCFDRKSIVQDLTQFPYPCYLKPSVSVDGAGISRCQNEQELRQALDNFDRNTPLQIQAEVDAFNFLNLQYQVTKHGLERLVATEQVLDGYAHCGNRFPTIHQPWELVDPIAEWMAVRGMKSIFAFDVAVVAEASGQYQYFAIECNPRFNGASYPTGTALKLDIPSWSCETFETDTRSVQDLDLRGIEFDSTTNTGVVLVNWGAIQVGKLAILLAGSVEVQNQLRTELRQRLSRSLTTVDG